MIDRQFLKIPVILNGINSSKHVHLGALKRLRVKLHNDFFCYDNEMKFIIVNGLPATGKTFLSSQISEKLDIPRIAKDDVKEFLFDKLGVKDREWSRSLGVASNDFLYELAGILLSKNHSLIMENAFEYKFAKPRFEKLIEKYKPDVFEIYCHTDKEIRRGRFVERNESGQRHAGHYDTDNYILKGDAEPIEKYDTLNVGKLIKIDTSDFTKIKIEDLIVDLSVR